jgi:hypothetical protein
MTNAEDQPRRQRLEDVLRKMDEAYACLPAHEQALIRDYNQEQQQTGLQARGILAGEKEDQPSTT